MRRGPLMLCERPNGVVSHLIYPREHLGQPQQGNGNSVASKLKLPRGLGCSGCQRPLFKEWQCPQGQVFRVERSTPFALISKLLNLGGQAGFVPPLRFHAPCDATNVALGRDYRAGPQTAHGTYGGLFATNRRT